MCILDFITLKKNGSNTRLLLLDIDSLTYEIKTEDVHESFSKVKEIFNFSNHST